MKSLETLNSHDQTHNDIKPQNFLVRFKNGPDDLTQIEIVLTDFGMADSDSKGGTPIFASPECFEKKEKKSDIFSFGRVILFLLLTKNQFVKWLFVPIKCSTRALHSRILTTSSPAQRLYLISQMTSLTDRISLQSAREIFNRQREKARIKLNQALIGAMETIINDELSQSIEVYTSELCNFRYNLNISIHVSKLNYF